MSRGIKLAVFAMFVLGLTTALFAQSSKQYVFPAKGQSEQQQASDESACAKWATGETGFDPANPPVYKAPPPPPPPQQGAGARGAVRGAAAGYIIGDIANDEGGEGAAIGAVVGATSARRKQQGAAQASQQQASADKAAFDQKVAASKQEWSKARAACLEAKGYTVK
ncbi:MAG: glycine zipper domain-containing protein [Thermoanaerobaculia bacterium]|jgi:hypothetical protein